MGVSYFDGTGPDVGDGSLSGIGYSPTTPMFPGLGERVSTDILVDFGDNTTYLQLKGVGSTYNEGTCEGSFNVHIES